MNASLKSALERLVEAEARGGQWAAGLSAGKNEPMWIQVLTDCINFWYPYENEPLERLKDAGFLLPPEAEILSWEAGSYATLRFGSWDFERVAALVDTLLSRFYGLPDDLALVVEMENLG
jgi:hypothetical protein